MNVGIVDDEQNNRLVIRNIINQNCPTVQITVEEGLIDKAIENLNRFRPELLFLDIELKNGTGFDIIQKLQYNPEIIFTTAYSQYAINAIKVHAFDYILKPINDNELIASLFSVKEKIKKNTQVETREHSVRKFYLINTNEGKQTLNYNHILYFEGAGAYTYCVTPYKRIIFSKNIGEVEKEIPQEVFFRTHNSFIVNLNKIKHIETKRSGHITMDNDDVLPISQRKIKTFLELFKNKVIGGGNTTNTAVWFFYFSAFTLKSNCKSACGACL